MELKFISPNELTPNNYALRKNALSLAPLMKSISDFGFITPIVANKNNVVISGNNRLEAAKLMKLESIPVVIVDLTDEQIEQYSLIDNQVQQLTGWNFAKKKEILDKYGIDIGAYGMSDEMREIEDIDSFFTEDDAISLF